jgi:hypothetical protein
MSDKKVLHENNYDLHPGGGGFTSKLRRKYGYTHRKSKIDYLQHQIQ